MASVKFPNVPKPIIGACSDGFPKHSCESQSECSEFICFQEPLIAVQTTTTFDAQVPSHVNQTTLNPQPMFQPGVKQSMSQPSFLFDDPWSEDFDFVEKSFHLQQLPPKNPLPAKLPTLLKVGEDPFDPWNEEVGDFDQDSQLPCFDKASNPQQWIPTFEPQNHPTLRKVGELDHDPWNTCEQLNGTLNRQPNVQTSSSRFVDTRNAL